MRLLFAVAASLAFATPAFADDHAMSEPQELTFERVFASPSLNGSSPREAKLSPDGRYLTLLRNREDERERYYLWGYDRDSGEWTMLVDSEKLSSGRTLSEDELMQRERQRVGSFAESESNANAAQSNNWSKRSTAREFLDGWNAHQEAPEVHLNTQQSCGVLDLHVHLPDALDSTVLIAACVRPDLGRSPHHVPHVRMSHWFPCRPTLP